ncbi:Fc.00g085830.m01.CDS01 [Cosmosporella sp. VM-42]
MGIPHLISTLEPYAVHEVLQNASVVIDGPALAYHILFICNKDGVVQPSYELLGKTAVAWLQELTNRGVRIDAIYFDGHLPLAKRPIRMQRMIKSFKQLKSFHSSHPKDCSLAYLSSTKDKVPDLFTSKQPPGKPFLPPSFHVPAIIEALEASPQYKSLVCLVPGEADAYCAQHLLERGGTVLTSDSDLLVHNLGEGRVAFLREIYLDGESGLVCASFSPSQICKRLRLPTHDLYRLAYERKCCFHSTLPQILQKCAEAIKDETAYNDFCQEYLHYETASLPTSAQSHPLPIDSLDPRLSELILQFGIDNKNTPILQEEDKIFLPILIEDPTRGSAWEQSTPIRQLAYTVARWIIPGTSSSVQEYRRVNMATQKGREVPLLPKAAAKKVGGNLVSLMAKLGVETNVDVKIRWQIFCLTLDIRECYDQDKQSHALHILQQSATSSPHKFGKVAWDTIHFVAHLQASYYSLRVLQQILSLAPDTESPVNLPGLRNMLSSLPPLSQFPDIEQTIAFLHKADQQGVLQTISQYVRIPQNPTSQMKQGPKVKKRKKKREKESISGKSVVAKTETQASRNLFDVLGQDQQ